MLACGRNATVANISVGLLLSPRRDAFPLLEIGIINLEKLELQRPENQFPSWVTASDGMWGNSGFHPMPSTFWEPSTTDKLRLTVYPASWGSVSYPHRALRVSWCLSCTFKAMSWLCQADSFSGWHVE